MDRRADRSNKTSRKGVKLDYQLARLGRRVAHALASGVLSFAGRVGAVVPQAGDYTAADVGADPTGTAAAAVAAHEAAGDPHTQYLTAAEGNAAYAPIAHVGAGGAAHANVVAAGAAGFMTGADKTKLDAISGTNTGDQTSIVGITGTLAEFNTALTGADFATGGGTVSGASSGTNTGDQTSIVGITGSLAEFNTALTGADFATGGGTATGTNTGDQTSIVGITGSLAEFNAALTGADFATGGGTVTGASSGTNTGDQTSIVGITGTKSQFNTALTDGNFIYEGLLGGVAANTAATGNINTTETNVISYTVPANQLVAGQTYRITVSGICTSTAANASNMRIRVGTANDNTDAIAAVVTPTAAASGTNIPFSATFLVTLRVAGASGTMVGSGVLTNNGVTGVSAAAVVVGQVSTSITVDTTVQNFIHMMYVSAASTTTCNFIQATIELVKP